MKVTTTGRLLLIASMFFSCATIGQVKQFTIGNGVIKAGVTPDIGGRLLYFSLSDKTNLLKVSSAVTRYPDPEINVESDGIGYLGHEIWAGPQSQWWAHQTLNIKRADEKATWPPDPYTSLAKNKILHHSDQKITIQSFPSPVSGLMFTKSYALIKNKKNSLMLNVEAKNIRTENIAWDIWFNTRVNADTKIYIPVVDDKDIREISFDTATSGMAYQVKDGIFMLDATAHPSGGKLYRKGKLLIQPSYGWIASYRAQQLFIIQFEHYPLSAIHPEQGQVEIYGDFAINDLAQGILELEVHAPYKALTTNQSMYAHELWTVLPYFGESTPEAHLAFLRSHAVEIGLANF